MRSWARGLRTLAAGVLLVSLWGCPLDQAGSDFPASRTEAWRFLNQATFGPDEANIERVTAIGYTAWIDEQFALKPAFTYRSFLAQRNPELSAKGLKPGLTEVVDAFYTRALTDKAQLRGRLAFSLSEIFVVSFLDDVLQTDILDANLDGNYRQLLEAVSKSPAMGQYLTFRGNSKELPAQGRFPDENYAREVMQLFSIGLHELNIDGTPKLDGKGQPIETYNNNDIKGLAKVFTGWSNYRGGTFASASESNCFAWALNCRDPEGFYQPMVAYPAYHSVSAKTFLGLTIPAQQTPSPQASLTAALDKLASHPNVAPFFCRQLIQRMVTSNPTPEYVARVATRFLDTKGSMKDTVKAILLDEEARGSASMLIEEHGKLREPILRVTALLRAFPITSLTLNTSGASVTGYVSLGNTADGGTSFGQAPFHAPSVFNFFRPGYTPPQSEAAKRAMEVPEMQLVNEASVSGYFNAVRELLVDGVGPSLVTSGPRNLKLKLDEPRALANDPAALVQYVADRLKGGVISDNLRTTMQDTLGTMYVPPLDATQSNAAEVNAALTKRVWGAILMVAVSPEFLVTK
jgi:uncharacterized protein (DUF1800 family)